MLSTWPADSSRTDILEGTFGEEHGLAADEIAESLDWAIRMLVEDLRRRQRKQGRKQ